MVAIVVGELPRSFDPAVSEWGNPTGLYRLICGKNSFHFVYNASRNDQFSIINYKFLINCLLVN